MYRAQLPANWEASGCCGPERGDACRRCHGLGGTACFMLMLVLRTAKTFSSHEGVLHLRVQPLNDLQMELSKSQRLVAYTLDDGMGSEVYSTYIKHIGSGRSLDYASA